MAINAGVLNHHVQLETILENKLKRRLKIYEDYKKNKTPNFNYKENTEEIKYLKEQLKRKKRIKNLR